MSKPTYDEKYAALPELGRDIVDHVVGSTRLGMEWAGAEFNRLCKEHGVKLGESCALVDIIRARVKAQL